MRPVVGRFRVASLVIGAVMAVPGCQESPVATEATTAEEQVPALARSPNLPRGFVATPADPPFYARVERPYVAPHDQRIAAIVFYRSPDCVPPDFNLLDLFDVPGAFGCPLTASGQEWRWHTKPPFTAPYLSILEGNGQVPIWFVSWSELQRAAQDDVVTRAELEGMTSLRRAVAARFTEWLEPAPTRNPSRTLIWASGAMPNGDPFTLFSQEEDFQIIGFRLRDGR